MMRTTGISALRKIRILVNDLDLQDRRNKKYPLVLAVIFILVILFIIHYFFIRDRKYQSINASYNKSFESDSIIGHVSPRLEC